eukprot:GHVP01014213.1.p1 GENE.GHVP01014213.1~~GHVP01014213.1.p1  ORF type:complete len:695 (+),score=124.10 GHVP01014213.1:1352-3436(+)
MLLSIERSSFFALLDIAFPFVCVLIGSWLYHIFQRRRLDSSNSRPEEKEFRHQNASIREFKNCLLILHHECRTAKSKQQDNLEISKENFVLHLAQCVAASLVNPDFSYFSNNLLRQWSHNLFFISSTFSRETIEEIYALICNFPVEFRGIREVSWPILLYSRCETEVLQVYEELQDFSSFVGEINSQEILEFCSINNLQLLPQKILPYIDVAKISQEKEPAEFIEENVICSYASTLREDANSIIESALKRFEDYFSEIKDLNTSKGCAAVAAILEEYDSIILLSIAKIFSKKLLSRGLISIAVEFPFSISKKSISEEDRCVFSTEVLQAVLRGVKKNVISWEIGVNVALRLVEKFSPSQPQILHNWTPSIIEAFLEILSEDSRSDLKANSFHAERCCECLLTVVKVLGTCFHRTTEKIGNLMLSVIRSLTHNQLRSDKAETSGVFSNLVFSVLKLAGSIPVSDEVDSDNQLRSTLLHLSLELSAKLGNKILLGNVLELFRNGTYKPFPVKESKLTSLLIKALGIAGLVEDVRYVWKKVVEDDPNVPPSEICCGCMIDVLVSNGLMDEAILFLDKCEMEYGVEPNTVMYTTLMKGYSKVQGNEDKCMKLVQRMKSRGVPLNTITYNSLVDSACRSGDTKSALAFLEEMVANQIQPDIVTFSTLVKGFCIRGLWMYSHEFYVDNSHKVPWESRPSG